MSRAIRARGSMQPRRYGTAAPASRTQRAHAAYSRFVPLLLDLTPLRDNAPYRRLYAGFTLSNVGSQLAVVAIGLQVYEITRSTAAVGIVGLLRAGAAGGHGAVRRHARRPLRPAQGRA